MIVPSMASLSGRLLPRALAAFVAVVLVLWLPTPASADPAGPTDFQTSIVGIEVVDDEQVLSEADRASVLESIELDILGGDSFVEMTVAPGTEVRVPGYRREPYLWFKADGSVVQNERSPARWLNEDRYSDIDLPDIVDPEAEPLWEQVSTDGTYAWHDHRAHWMNGEKPLGAEPGDTVVDDFVVLHVGQDRTEVRVAVRSILLEPPSPMPALLGGVSSLALATGAALVWRRARSGSSDAIGALTVPGLVVGGWSLLAGVVGYGAVLGLPAEAAPGVTNWALPAVGGLAVVGALIERRRGLLAPALSDQVLPAALLLAGLELCLWGFLRREAVTSSLIPTELPMWLDRAVVSGSVVVGALALALASVSLVGRRVPPSAVDGGRAPGPAGLRSAG